MVTRGVVSIVLMMAAVATANAQPGAAFGPQVGFYKAQDADKARGIGGLALRLKLSDGLGVEGSVNYREEKYGNGFTTVKSWPVMVTGLLYPLPIVYGAAGAGWYNSSIDYNAVPSVSETKQEFGWHFGGGAELPVGTSAKLIGDIKYVFLNYDFQNFPGSNGMKSNFYVLTAGILFKL